MTYTENFPIEFDPVACENAVISGPKVRFTVLTSRLLRLEYSPTDTFEDRPSQVFWYRYLPVPEFEARHDNHNIELETQHLHLRYTITKSGFTQDTLSIRIKTDDITWRYSQDNPQNLLGTARTLDNIDGAVSLEEGLLSLSHWAVVDDAHRLVFNNKGWLEPRGAPGGTKDLYFFGYGVDYVGCLRDFCKVSGQVPLLPRWALGNWWSRYWQYSADELLGLMDEFRAHDVPLAVCIVDMDWHLTETGNASSGWTGYTWNRELFPDPPAFLDGLHVRGLRTALNLHPAEGIHPHEERYSIMAEHLGVDPESDSPIPFDIADPEFTRAYFEILHHPYEAMGVDFWWMDWQQGELSSLPGLDPLWWLNHLHFYDLGREERKRRFIFSRWGGLGNHRYPIGFSGDTQVTWESLAFQPYFTATAANVGYSWWSHDIGGHMGGIEDSELFVRWVQFGVFSPILRLHSTNNPFHERRPWGYDAETERVTRDAFQLRHALIPYLYTMAWRNHTKSLALVRPMYHDYPDEEPAYHCPDQYTFGSELIVAPFISPSSPEIRLSRQVVWLPEGDWFDFFSGLRYPGDGWQAIYGELEDIPAFARAGAIVPLGPKVGWGGVENPDELQVHLFPCADNNFELYEDDGLETHSLTSFMSNWTPQKWTFEIGASQGSTGHLPSQREYKLFFRGVCADVKAQVICNGVVKDFSSHYEEETSTLRIAIAPIQPEETMTAMLTTQADTLLVPSDYRLVACRKFVRAFRMDTRVKARLDKQLPEILDSPTILTTYQLSLTEEQTRALVEVIAGAGLHRSKVRRGPKEEIILWNNRENKHVTYQFLALDMNNLQKIRRQGLLPTFARLYPEGDLLRFESRNQEAHYFNQAVDWFNALPRRFRIDSLAGRDAVVQFRVTGVADLVAYLLVHDSLAHITRGEHCRPHASLTISEVDFLMLVNGQVSVQDLFVPGGIQIGGDVDLLHEIYQSLQLLPRDIFLADRWKLYVDYIDMLRLQLSSL